MGSFPKASREQTHTLVLVDRHLISGGGDLVQHYCPGISQGVGDVFVSAGLPQTDFNRSRS